MASILCPKCEQETPDPTKPCPGCGYQISLLPLWALWVDIVLFIASVVGFQQGGSPLMLGFAVGTFLYMIYDLGKRNSLRPVVPKIALEPEDVTIFEPAPEKEPSPEEEDERVCQFCGAALEEGAKYCGHCGRKQGS